MQGCGRLTKALTALGLAAILVAAAPVLLFGCGTSAASGDGQACAQCGSHEVIPIIYGLPDAGLLEQAEAGEVILGGCVIDEDCPAWHCGDCGHEWGRLGDIDPEV